MTNTTSEQVSVPTEAGVWIVVLGELCVFTLFFATFLYYRSLDPELFAASSATLQDELGALNTLILLASSWCVASAVTALGAGNTPRQVLVYLFCAMACGVAFVVVKLVEYDHAISAGANVLTDSFYMFYFMFTGIHLLHLIVGFALLWGATLHLRGVFSAGGAVNHELIGFASCFWHMVDIVWIVLFPLLYLLQ